MNQMQTPKQQSFEINKANLVSNIADLESQKLVIAVRIREHNNISYKEEEDVNKSALNKTQKENISQTGIKSKSNIQSQSSLSSLSNITAKTNKTGISQSKLGANKEQKKKKDDSKVNIYTCKMSDKNPITQIVNLNQAPLSYSLLSKYLKSDQDITEHKQALLPKSRQYSFDVAFSQESSQDDVYSTLIKKKVKTVLNGFQTSVFIVGSQYSGRKYTLRGDDNFMNKNAINEKGLMIRTCEDILSLIDISKESIRSRKATVGGVYYNLGVQMYCVRDDAEVDLLVNAPEQLLNKDDTQEVEMGCFDITSVDDLLVYYRQAQNRFKMINDTLKGQDFKRNATIFIRFLILKSKQVYSSVNFAIFFDFDLLNQNKFYPIRDYLREVEKMAKRQLKSYEFKNKVLLHLNKCFSSGPEYNAILLGQFDSTPSQIENSQHLLQIVSIQNILQQILSNLRQSNSSKAKGTSGQINMKMVIDPSNQEQNVEEYEQDREVQAFIFHSNKKSQGSNHKSELNETAGFQEVNGNQDDMVNEQFSLPFQGGDQSQQDIKNKQRGLSDTLEKGSKNEDTSKVDGKNLNTFGNENTIKIKNNKNHLDYDEFYQQNNNQFNNSGLNQQQQSMTQSKKNPQDIESSIREVFSYSDVTRSMDEQQKLQWVEYVNLLKPPRKGSAEELKYKKVIEAKTFLSDLKGELNLKEYVQKNLRDSIHDDNDSFSSGVDTRAYLNNPRRQERVILKSIKFKFQMKLVKLKQTIPFLIKKINNYFQKIKNFNYLKV